MHETDERSAPDDGSAPFSEVVYSYSRQQAIADGVLVDVSQTAREAAFKWPLAMTAEVWALIEQIPVKYRHEDIQGRLWDVLTIARLAASRAGKDQDIIFFDVILHRAQGDKVRLKLHVGPGDHGEPVLTIMLPDQD